MTLCYNSYSMLYAYICHGGLATIYASLGIPKTEKITNSTYIKINVE